MAGTGEYRPLTIVLSRGKTDATRVGCYIERATSPNRFPDDRRRHPVLETQIPLRDDGPGVGVAVRRLRQVLPGQARGRRRFLQDLFHRCRLQAARRRDLPLHRLQAPHRQGEGLRAADAAQHPPHRLAAAVLRLPARRRRQGPLLVASADLGRSGDRAHRRRLGARARRRDGGGGARRGAGGSDCRLAAEAVAGGTERRRGRAAPISAPSRSAARGRQDLRRQIRRPS